MNVNLYAYDNSNLICSICLIMQVRNRLGCSIHCVLCNLVTSLNGQTSFTEAVIDEGPP